MSHIIGYDYMVLVYLWFQFVFIFAYINIIVMYLLYYVWYRCSPTLIKNPRSECKRQIAATFQSSCCSGTEVGVYFHHPTTIHARSRSVWALLSFGSVGYKETVALANNWGSWRGIIGFFTFGESLQHGCGPTGQPKKNHPKLSGKWSLVK